MATHNLVATVTDNVGAVDSDTLAVTSTATAAQRVVSRSFLENRINWSVIDPANVRGPLFSDVDTQPAYITAGFLSPPGPISLSMIFTVLIPVRITGCRIYKAPNLAGTIPVKCWSGVETGIELASESVVWTADGGGWRQIDFASPVEAVPGTTYNVGYFSPSGIFAYSLWIWHGRDTCVWPLYNTMLHETTLGRFDGTGQGTHPGAPAGTPAIVFPNQNVAHSYYIDPIVEWDDPLPAYTGGTDYWDQWTSGGSRHAFPFAVFFADPEFVAEYYDMGINTLIGGSPCFGENAQAYIDAMADTGTGNQMDWWPALNAEHESTSFNPAAQLVQTITDNPALAAQIVGYQLRDELDTVGPYIPPGTVRTWVNALRQRDATRPIFMNFGPPVTRNMVPWGLPAAGPLVQNETWRAWAECCDVISVDDYTWFFDNNADGTDGVWNYAAQVGRMRELVDDRTPVWIVVESTGQVADPDPDDIVRSIWAALIAGARGITLFDHRFATDFVTQDFAAMLHNAPMKAAITALAARIESLGQALLAPDLGLVTAYTSSNTTDGPIGGTYGVPIHYTSRQDDDDEYVFAQAIRPGATTATLTIPTWVDEVVDVIDEARTVTVSSGGVLTDTFAADYEYHLYRKTGTTPPPPPGGWDGDGPDPTLKPTAATTGPTVSSFTNHAGGSVTGVFTARRFTGDVAVDGGTSAEFYDCIIEGEMAINGAAILEDCTIEGGAGTANALLIASYSTSSGFAGTQIRRCWIESPSETQDLLRFQSGPTFGDNSYYLNITIEDTIFVANYRGDVGAHFDLLQTGGGRNITMNRVVFNYTNTVWEAGASAYLNCSVGLNYNITDAWFEGGPVANVVSGVELTITNAMMERSTRQYGYNFESDPAVLDNVIDDLGDPIT